MSENTVSTIYMLEIKDERFYGTKPTACLALSDGTVFMVKALAQLDENRRIMF